jgi:primase-polymerase (primpol)-like protein
MTPQPAALPVQPDTIPQELKALPQWVCWRYVLRDDKWTKQPVSIHTGDGADSTDPTTWASYEDALAFYQQFHPEGLVAGIGFVFAKEADPRKSLCGIDLDKCRDPATGKLGVWAQVVLQMLASYSEVSPSGTGVKVWVKGRMPLPAGKGGTKRSARYLAERLKLPDGGGALECYNDSRYFAMTGARLPQYPGTVNAPDPRVLRKLYTNAFEGKTHNTGKHASADVPATLTGEEVIRKASRAKNGDRFRQLWEGKWSEAGYPSQSEADLALCGMLAFWTGKDAGAIDCLFRDSGLMRDKWDEGRAGETYGNRTISKAVEECQETYSPAKAREDEEDDGEGRGRRPSDHDALIELARSGACDLWTTPNSESFATVQCGSRQEHLPVLERPFADWLLGSFEFVMGRVPRPDTIKNAAESIAGLARLGKVRHEAFVRVGWEWGESPASCKAVWVDLGDDTWQAVRITKEGWTVEAQPAVRFRRSDLLAPLPEPTCGTFDLLRPLVNVGDDDWPAVLAFLVGCYVPPPATLPILCPHGRAGAGKSTLLSQIEALVDPRTDDPTTGVPSSVEALMLTAERSWLQRFNNASTLTEDQSNLLCTLVEGTTMPKRTAYTDRGLTIVRARRPIVLNGISIVPERTDLLDRCLPIALVPPTPEKVEAGQTDADEGVVQHKTNAQLKAAFEAVRPAVLGALYTAVASALRHYDTTVLDDPPRLHDFAHWATAAEPGLGLPAGAVLAALGRTRREAQAAGVEASPLPSVLRAVVAAKGGKWEASAEEWLAALNAERPLARYGKQWPTDPRDLGQKLTLLAPDLPAAGLVAARRRGHGKRLWMVRILPQAGQPPAPAPAGAPATPPAGAPATPPATDPDAQKRLLREQTRAR